MNGQFGLRIKQGAKVNKTWPIGPGPLVIGRNPECGIRIVDATISRRHCEVWVDHRGPVVRDLKSSNSTIVNGAPIVEAALALGDFIELGPYTLEVVAIDPAQPADAPAAEPTSTATLSLSDAYFVQESESDLDRKNAPPYVAMFRDLLRSQREFAKCARITNLLSALEGLLERHFHPEACWLVRTVGAERRLVPYPQCARLASDSLPVADLQKAIAAQSGFLVPRRRTGEGRTCIETSMIAPLIVGDEHIGALAVRTVTPKHVYDESDLEFFLGLAHAFAPFLCAAERSEQLQRDIDRFRQREAVPNTLIGNSAEMKKVRELVGRAAKSDLPVLVLGETGTGKELVARMIHDMSGRAKQPYVVVNAAAIPRELCESEMFGYEKGAFTGAIRQKSGYFEEAHNGTLFLDEIGDLSPDNQARILRAIETGQFNRVGGIRPITVDVRIVSATNRALTGKKSAAEFRQDLYHRLSGFVINLPPLRERRTDIPELIDYFLGTTHRSGGAARKYAPEALEKLMAHDWPGNVRELRASVERSAAISDGDTILLDDIIMPGGAGKDPDSGSGILTLEDAEKHHIQRILTRHNGNVRSAAQALKISRVTLYKKIQDYDLSL